MRQTVKREERLKVNLLIAYPNLHQGKSYVDENRNFTISVDGGEETPPLKGFNEEFRLRALIVIRKKYREKVDSTFTYRVGENFAELQVTGYSPMRIAINFESSNTLRVLDDCSHIRASRILN